MASPLFHLSIVECRKEGVDSYRVLATVLDNGHVLRGLTCSEEEFTASIDFLNRYKLEERLRHGKKISDKV